MNLKTALRYFGQVAVYGLFALIVGYFSTSPAYTVLAPGQALLKLSFVHAGERVGECRDRSDAELAELPPNMRIRRVCPRERSPLTVELEVDGKRLYRAVIPPSGLAHDGPASVYQRFAIPAGPHRISVRMGDRRSGGFNHILDSTLSLTPAQILVIDFDPVAGKLVFKQ